MMNRIKGGLMVTNLCQIVRTNKPENLQRMADWTVLLQHEGVRRVAQHILDCASCRQHFSGGRETPVENLRDGLELAKTFLVAD